MPRKSWGARPSPWSRRTTRARARRWRRRAPSPLEQDGGRLDDRGRLDAGSQLELLDRLARDDGDDTEWPCLELDLGDHAAEPVPRRQRSGGLAASAHPLDLGRCDDAAVRAVARGRDPALAIPAAQRV